LKRIETGSPNYARSQSVVRCEGRKAKLDEED